MQENAAKMIGKSRISDAESDQRVMNCEQMCKHVPFHYHLKQFDVLLNDS